MCLSGLPGTLPSLHSLLTDAAPLCLCSAASISDAISLVNQTNVVVKGIIGLGAMGKIADAVGQSGDASHFSVRIPSERPKCL